MADRRFIDLYNHGLLTKAATTAGTPFNFDKYTGKSFLTTSQVSDLRDVCFNSNGTKMYLLDTNQNKIFQYTVLKADPSTATYDEKSFDLTSQGTNFACIRISEDGNKLYALNQSGSTIFQYSLSLADDISTATYDAKSFSFLTQEANGVAFFLKSDGTKIFVVGLSTNTVYSYSFGTNFDVSTLTYDSVSFSVAAVSSSTRGIFFDPDGDTFFVCDGDYIYQYATSSSWTITGSVYKNLYRTEIQDTNNWGMFFTNSGEKFCISGGTTDRVYEYKL